MKISYSSDGGQTWQEAPEGIRIIVENDAGTQLHLNRLAQEVPDPLGRQ